MNKVVRTERGWAGHFICGNECLFRRNTLLEYKDLKVVVSTVGAMPNHLPNIYGKEKFMQIGSNRYYETMVFHSKTDDNKYHDIDVQREIGFKSPWCVRLINEDTDNTANKMHEDVVAEITNKLMKGDINGKKK